LKTEIALAKEEYTANIEKSKVEMMEVLLEKDVADAFRFFSVFCFHYLKQFC
jgi:hypothetical protein